MGRIFFLIICILFCNIASSGTIHPETKDQQHIDYGNKFSHTVVVTGKSKDTKSFLGSGVIIGPYYVLTAAHIVHDSDKCFVIIDETKGILVESIICHKDFDMEKYGFNDIAIIKLSKKVDHKWFSPLYTKDDEVKKIVSIAGYGATGDFKNGYDISGVPLKKRAGSNIIDRVQDHLLITSASDTDRTSLEFLIAIGDSGGPLYINNKIAGINSCVMSTDGKSDSSYGDEAGHTRISLFADWIKENTKD